MAPPQLPADAPVLQVAHPREIGVLPVLGHKLDAAVFHGLDGGRGQLNAVREVMQELSLDDIMVVGVSKGPDRNAGREQFHIDGRDSFTLPMDSPAMHFLQRLRDESHRFAIGAHRTRRTNASLKSPLDEIEGIGPKRKKALLAHFGSARSVSRAAVADLMMVDGISEMTAQDIYNHFHNAKT